MDRSLIKTADVICAPMHYQDGSVREGVIAALAVTRLSGEDAIYSSPIVRPLGSDSSIISLGLFEAAKLGLAAYSLNRTDNLIARFPGANYKIFIEVYGDSVVAVAVEIGHVVNKSIRRIIKRAARRAGLKKVESCPAVPAANEIPSSPQSERTEGQDLPPPASHGRSER